MMPMNQRLESLERSQIRTYTSLGRQTPGCLMLTLGEPDFDTPQPIKEAARAAMAAGQTHYAPNQGLPALCRAVADYETGRGLPCTPAQVLITAGATGALFTALLGILNPGDEVIVPMPAFPLYASIIAVAGAKLVPLDTSKSDFQICEGALKALLTDKTRAILLNSPNNPTGVVYTAASLAAVKAAVLGKPIYLICDNVYDRLTAQTPPDLSLDAELAGQVLLCQSFSKPYAMTGWRVGYLVGPEAVMQKLLLLSAAEVASIPTFLQQACVTALGISVGEMARVYEERRKYVTGRLRQMGLPFPEPGGAFYVFPDISAYGLSSGEFCTRMIREAGVAAVPGSCFGAEGHLRISCACSDETLQNAMDRTERFLRSLK